MVETVVKYLCDLRRELAEQAFQVAPPIRCGDTVEHNGRDKEGVQRVLIHRLSRLHIRPREDRDQTQKRLAAEAKQMSALEI